MWSLIVALSTALADPPADPVQPDATAPGPVPTEPAPAQPDAEPAPASEPAAVTEPPPTPPLGVSPTLPANYPRFEKPKPPPTHRIWYRSATFGRINPLGLQSILDIGYRYQLVKSPSVFFADSYFFVGPTINASPSFLRGGLKLEVMPLSVLRFHVQYQAIGYLGSFDNLSSFPTNNSDFSDQAMSDGESYLTTGGVFNAGVRFQLKIAAFAFRNTAEFAYFHLNLRNGDTVFYEQFWDRAVPNRGWAVQNDLDVMGAPGRFRVGVRWTYSDTIVGDDSGVDLPNHRIGPLFAYEFHDRKPGARFNHPTLFFTAQWWLQHRYRTGQQQPWGLPLIAIGLLFDGDLIGPRPPR